MGIAIDIILQIFYCDKMSQDTLRELRPWVGTYMNLLRAEDPGEPAAEHFDISVFGLQHTYTPPEGYEYASSGTAEELAGLLRENYPPRKDKARTDNAATWLRDIEDLGRRFYCFLDVGVRHIATQDLVGYGRIESRGLDAMFSTLVVSDSNHRHKGIGRLLVSERVAIADRLQMGYIHIPFLENSNSLRQHYMELGFQERGISLERFKIAVDAKRAARAG